MYKFLKREQPALSLHGHVHESPRMSGVWKARIGNTVAIQPGQTEHGGALVAVLVDVEDPDGAKLATLRPRKKA